MRLRCKISTSLFALTLLGTVTSLPLSSASASAEELKISVGVSVMKNVVGKIHDAFEKESGIKLVTIGIPAGNGSDQVFKDVDAGKAEAGIGGIDWDSWLKMMQEKKYTAAHLSEITHRVIGNDRIQIMVNPEVAVDHLTMPQITDLLTGKITRWKEVGGADLPVHLVLSKTQPATQKFVQERAIGGKTIKTEGALMADDNDLMVAKISATPGAFGFGPRASATDKVKSPEHPTIGRPLVLITVGKPNPATLKLIDFIKKEGPKLGIR